MTPQTNINDRKKCVFSLAPETGKNPFLSGVRDEFFDMFRLLADRTMAIN